MSNAERQARWREKNRAIFNLRRRNARKKKGSDATCQSNSNQMTGEPCTIRIGSEAVPTVRSSGAATIEELRELVANVSKEPPVEHAPSKPLIYRDDFGRVITERQWNILQEKKSRAKEAGYEIDAYSQ